MPLSGAFGAFLFRASVAFGAFLSIDSIRSFPRVGHGVGQALRVCLLEVELTLCHPDHKIVFQPGHLERDDVIPLEHRPQIDKILFIRLGQRRAPPPKCLQHIAAKLLANGDQLC